LEENLGNVLEEKEKKIKNVTCGNKWIFSMRFIFSILGDSLLNFQNEMKKRIIHTSEIKS
jgi:hypothetical protein